MKTPISSELLDKYLDGTCTPQEQEEVEKWYQSFENSPEMNTLYPETESEDYSNSVFEKIKSKIKLKKIEDMNIWKLPINKQAYWYLAASVLIGIGVSFLLEKNHVPVKSKSTLAHHSADFFDMTSNHKNSSAGFSYKTISPALIIPV
jgi:hypothetical protein